MDQLKNYINEARNHDHSDAQIRQDLVGAGWDIAQVDQALNPVNLDSQPYSAPNVLPPQAQAVSNLFLEDKIPASIALGSSGSGSKLSINLIIASLSMLLLLIIIIGSSLALLGHKTSYQSVINEFITALQKKDKKTADSLESPAMRGLGQKYVGDPSFYDTCHQSELLCSNFFEASFLKKATITRKAYKASNGIQGHEVIYTVKQTLSGSQAGGKGCSSSSTTTLAFDVVPSGSTWLLDNVSPGIDATVNLCSPQSINTTQ